VRLDEILIDPSRNLVAADPQRVGVTRCTVKQRASKRESPVVCEGR
jgi:hypothetical protein